MRRGSFHLPAALERYLELLGIRSARGGERHGHLIPTGPRKGGFVRGRVLLVGDAAGLVDPLTGEGISYAVRSGQIAAEVLAAGALDPERVRHAYERKLRSEILPELRVGRWLAAWVYGVPTVRTCLIRHWGTRLGQTLVDIFNGERTYRAATREARAGLRP